LLRYLELRTRRWLFVARVCGGLSILMKVIGAYYIAGVLLFLAFLEQSESLEKGSEKSAERERSNNSWPYRVFSVGALALPATLINVLRTRLGMPELYQFVLPSAVVVALILLGESSVRAGTGQVQFPFAAPIYLSYAVPLMLLALVAIVSTGQNAARNVCAGAGSGAISGVWGRQPGSALHL